jgi:Argonaute siRNA chaperone (ARC) complex subunit Arb1
MNGTKEGTAVARATDAVEDDEILEVDFEWVMRGFLGCFFPSHHGWKGESDILLAVCVSIRRLNLKCDILENFLCYVEYHEAFPEYVDSINSAKAILKKARVELILNRYPLYTSRLHLGNAVVCFPGPST